MNELIINKTSIPLDTYRRLSIAVGTLPSGTNIDLQVNVYRAPKPGPTMLLMGGVHGDEINGIEIVRRACTNGILENLVQGTVIAIPLLNIYGFINFSRDTPDGKDVNRSFPGIATGSLSSRVARTITKQILPHIDFAIDFHTGGSSRYNYPQVRYSKDHNASETLAKIFASPYILEKAAISKSFRKVAVAADIPVLTYEGGETMRLDGLAIQKGIEGIQRVLQYKGMTNTSFPTPDYIIFKKTAWLRASKAGLFEWTKCSGQYVEIGEKIGLIKDPSGYNVIPVIARHSGYIIGHNNSCVIHSGDALFHFGLS